MSALRVEVVGYKMNSGLFKTHAKQANLCIYVHGLCCFTLDYNSLDLGLLNSGNNFDVLLAAAFLFLARFGVIVEPLRFWLRLLITQLAFR